MSPKSCVDVSVNATKVVGLPPSWQAYTVPDLTLVVFLITKSKKAESCAAVDTLAIVVDPVSTSVSI